MLQCNGTSTQLYLCIFKISPAAFIFKFIHTLMKERNEGGLKGRGRSRSMGTLHCPLCVGSSPDSAACVTRHSSQAALAESPCESPCESSIGTAFLRLDPGSTSFHPSHNVHSLPQLHSTTDDGHMLEKPLLPPSAACMHTHYCSHVLMPAAHSDSLAALLLPSDSTKVAQTGARQMRNRMSRQPAPHFPCPPFN